MPEPEKTAETPEALDVRAIRHLVRLMKRYDLTAIDFIEGPTQIRLRRRGPEPSPAASQSVAHPPAFVAPVASHPTAAPAPSVAAPPAPPSGLVIESPMVGTYYSSGSPDTPAFVSVGSTVRADTTVCIIEAMKVFTDIPSGVAGTVTEILVKNGQSVEYGQPMFRVNPS